MLFSAAEIEEIRRFLQGLDQKYADLGEVYPTNIAPVIIDPGQGDFQTTLMTWGFPQYSGSGVVINARSESAATKPMFKNSLSDRRCVIIATGFYEWSGTKGAKIKHLFNRPDSRALFMAGIFNEFTAEKEKRFAILTTDANASVEAIHSRMPVVLLPGEIDVWLRGDYLSVFERQQIDLVHTIADEAQLPLF